MPTFACPACTRQLHVKTELAGKKGKCPHCGHALTVPAADGGRREARGEGAAPAAGGAPPHELTDFLAPPQGPGEIGRLGPYRILKILGSGGMGVVYQAEDTQLERPVALKAILPGMGASASARQRFLQEAKAAAAVKHDHVVTIYQVGEDQGVPFLAMEFLRGEPLDERLKREGALPTAEVLRIGRQVALGLAAAHARGLIHRDIKPANVWLEAPRGRVKILDFGLARAAGGTANLTTPGAIMGTPAYMAPEQAAGGAVDHRCDLFSLGVVLYRLATGEAPFRGKDAISTLVAVSTDQPRPPREVNPAVPEALADLVMQLLSKDPAGRPRSAEAVAASLRQVERQLEEKHEGTVRLDNPLAAPPAPQPAKSRKGRRAAGCLGLLAVLAGGAAAALYFLPIDLPLNLPFGLTTPTTAPGPGQAPPPPGFVSLFNGKDLTGWEVAQGSKGDWKVQDGALVCFASEHGWLKSARQYTDFVLRLECRVGPKGNTGIYVHVPDGPGDVWKSGSEIQFLDEAAHPALKVRDRCGAIMGVAGPPRSLFKGVEQWHSLEITSKGGLTVTVNGEPAASAGAELLAGRPRQGSLGLQSWRGRAEFRNIAIRELPAAAPPPPPKAGPIAPRWTATGAFEPGKPFLVALAPDGKGLVSGGTDRRLRLWDAATGKPLPPDLGGTHEIHRLGFAGDGRHFVTAEGWASRVTVWDVKTRQRWVVAPASGEHSRNLSAAFSGDGRVLADLNANGTVSLYDVGSRKQTAVLAGSPGEVSGLGVSPDGGFVAASVKVGTARAPADVAVWVVAKPGKPTLHHRGELRYAPRFSADGRSLAIPSGTLLHRLAVPSFGAPPPPVRLELSPTGPFVLGDGAEVAVGVTDDPKQVAVCDATTGRRKATLASPAKVLNLSVARDGKTVVAACDDGCLRLWHLE